MSLGVSGPQVFIRHPEEMPFYCDCLSDVAARSRQISKRKAYQVLRSLNAQQLFDLYDTERRDGKDAFVAAFMPVYAGVVG